MSPGERNPKRMSHDLLGKESNTGTDLLSVQQTPVKLEHGTDESYFKCDGLAERTLDPGNSPVMLDDIKTEINEICLVSNSQIKTIPICDEVNRPPPGLIPHCDSREGTSKSNGLDRATYRLYLGKTIEYKYKQKLLNDDIKQYHCPKCEHVTASIPHLKNHLKDNHLSNMLFCDECQMLFMTEVTLKQHNFRSHQTGKEWKCDKCNFRTSQYRCILSHRKKHQKILLQCAKCDKKFMTRSQKQCHMQKKHLDIFPENETYKCNICNVKFLQRSHLDKHNWKHFGIRPYSCRLCDFKSRYSKSISKHMLVKHTFLTKLRCSCCFKKFYDQKLLKEHEVSHLVRQCPICPQKTSSWSQLTEHFREVHQKDGQVKSIQCDRCSKKFTTFGSLVRHSAKFCPILRSAQKPWQCNKCFSRFTTNASLDRHVATACKVLLNKEAVKPHQCALCLLRYASSYSLKHHLKEKHGKLFCLKCSEIFSNKAGLDYHAKNSTCAQNQNNVPKKVEKNVVNFKCLACNEQFSKVKVLKRHQEMCVFK